MMSSVPTAATSNSPDAGFQTNGQIVLILCGLIASGKSTFAEALQEHYPNFRRCNQDDLGDRRAVEQLARDTLREGLSICIDRTNFNASQRSYWIQIAREFPGTEIWVIVFDTPYEVCAERLKHRTSHPTITSPEQGLSVLSRFASDFRPPAAHEGFHRILYIKPSDHTSPVYTRADVTAVLLRVQSSPLITHAAQNAQPGYGYQGGQYSRGGRGGGGYYSSPRGGYSDRGRRGDGWNDYRSPGPSRGRGDGGGSWRSRTPNNGPPNDIRGWLNTSYRGNVGLHANTRGTAAWRYPSGTLGNQSSNSTEYVRQGTGTEQDAFVID
ncbi:P-loop containing nucleoside triphosphate hydrolase protein [Agrocybe pediades]|nr:P-loop containing nucleoside triphosphate hydrolase protein [Agrocybe pediades]